MYEQRVLKTLFGAAVTASFTYYILNGLAGEADSSSDGAVTASELADYVQGNVGSDPLPRSSHRPRSAKSPRLFVRGIHGVDTARVRACIGCKNVRKRRPRPNSSCARVRWACERRRKPAVCFQTPSAPKVVIIRERSPLVHP